MAAAAGGATFQLEHSLARGRQNHLPQGTIGRLTSMRPRESGLIMPIDASTPRACDGTGLLISTRWATCIRLDEMRGWSLSNVNSPGAKLRRKVERDGGESQTSNKEADALVVGYLTKWALMTEL